MPPISVTWDTFHLEISLLEGRVSPSNNCEISVTLMDVYPPRRDILILEVDGVTKTYHTFYSHLPCWMCPTRTNLGGRKGRRQTCDTHAYDVAGILPCQETFWMDRPGTTKTHESLSCLLQLETFQHDEIYYIPIECRMTRKRTCKQKISLYFLSCISQKRTSLDGSYDIGAKTKHSRHYSRVAFENNILQ
jgi:hypothetical protein